MAGDLSPEISEQLWDLYIVNSGQYLKGRIQGGHEGEGGWPGRMLIALF